MKGDTITHSWLAQLLFENLCWLTGSIAAHMPACKENAVVAISHSDQQAENARHGTDAVQSMHQSDAQALHCTDDDPLRHDSKHTALSHGRANGHAAAEVLLSPSHYLVKECR